MLGIKSVTSLVYLMVIVSYVSGLICVNDQYEHEGRCCPLCAKGTHVKRHCSADNPKTECSPCQNETYTADWNQKLSCTSCLVIKQCRVGMHITQKCTSTTDYKCDCKLPSQYLNTDLDFCMDCNQCSPGTYPENPCSKKTTCTSCPPNTFSNKSGNYNSVCQKCTACKRYKTRCSRFQDAVCNYTVVVDISTIPVGQEQVSSSQSPSASIHEVSTEGSENESSTNDSIFVDQKIIIIIIAIAVLLVIFGMVWFLQRRKGLCRRKTRFTMIEESKYERLTTGLLLRNLSSRILIGVHNLINPDPPPNWKNLAAELGFQYNEIANFELERTRSAENMLASWQTRGTSTVDCLHEALLKIGREDAANFVVENIPEDVTSDV